MFSEELEKYDWDEVTACINAKTEADVRRALTPGRRCTVDDFMALISPAAEPYLETMARLSRRYTEERFDVPCPCSFRCISPTPAQIPACIAVSTLPTR